MESTGTQLLEAIKLRTAANQSALVRRQIANKTVSSTVAAAKTSK
jgi:hypothetical protein